MQKHVKDINLAGLLNDSYKFSFDSCSDLNKNDPQRLIYLHIGSQLVNCLGRVKVWSFWSRYMTGDIF